MKPLGRPKKEESTDEPKKKTNLCLVGGKYVDLGFYSYDDIDKYDAVYNLIIGQRSNGKTYGACKKILDAYIDEKLPSAYIRRLDKQIVTSNVSYLFDPHSDYIKEKTKGQYNGIKYYSHAFYLARFEETTTGEIKRVAADAKPFCRVYAINTAETTKGQDAGAVKYIVFDEFITRQWYLGNEFVHFQNLLSSIIRNRDGVKIYMLANTVNKFCPYFAEMGVKDVGDMKPGTINIYRIGKTKTKIAVEYCAQSNTSKKVSKYFAFDNPQLNMITTGAWEIALYRHAPNKLDEYPIIFNFFVVFNEKIVQGDIYNYKDYPIIFYHPKTTELQHPEKDVIYYQDIYDGNPLHMSTITGGQTKAQKLIERLIKTNRTFYSDNSTGEIINNWLKFALVPQLLK